MLTELSHYSVFSSLSEDVDHHKLICWWWLRSLLITLSLKIDRLICQRWVFTVVYDCEFKCSDVDELYTLHQHLYKVQQKVQHCKECLSVSCKLHMSHLSVNLKSQKIQQYVIEDEEGQKWKKRYAKSTVNIILLWCYKERRTYQQYSVILTKWDMWSALL